MTATTTKTIVFDYTDADGKVIHTEKRIESFDAISGEYLGKKIVQERPDPTDTRRFLYDYPRILKAKPDDELVIVEGPRCADTWVDDMGRPYAVATTSPEGAGKWSAVEDECKQALLKFDEILILADNDRAGIDHAQDVARDLVGRGHRNVQILRSAVPGWDIRDVYLNDTGESDDLFSMLVSVEIDSGWEEPAPLQSPLPIVSAEWIPAPLGPIVSSIAKSVQVSPDLVFLTGLTVASAATRGNWTVRCSSSWQEELPFWGMPLADSGERKSAAIAPVVRPLKDAEIELAEDPVLRTNRARWTDELNVAEARLERAKRAASSDKGSMDEVHIARDALTDVLAKEPPPVPRFFADDVTPEALTKLLATHGSVAAISAEGGLIGTLAGRYANNPNLDTVLKGFSREDILRDRTGEGVGVRRPHLAIALVVQPDVLREVLDVPEMNQRGFVQRFVYSLTAPLAGKRSIADVPLDDIAIDDWNTAIRRIVDKTKDRRPGDPEVVLTIDPDVRELFDEWRQEVEHRLHPETGDLAHIKEWGVRLPGHVIRVSALLALLDDPETTVVGRRFVEAGIEISDWLVAHAEAALGFRDRPRTTKEGAVLAVIQRILVDDRTRSTVTTRDVYRLVRDRRWVGRGPGGTEDVRAVLESLEGYGYVQRVEQRRRRAGRPSEEWFVHPELMPQPEPQIPPGRNPFLVYPEAEAS